MSSTQQQFGTCPNCGFAVNTGSRFCMNCAFDLTQMASTAPTQVWPSEPVQAGCPNCGALLGPGATFCGNCGRTVGAAPKSKKLFLIGAVAFVGLALVGAAVWYFFFTGSSVKVSFTEKLLASIPNDYKVEDYNIEFSPDGTKTAYLAHKDGASKEFVVGPDGKAGKEYDDVGRLIFSVDGSKYAYLAKDGTNAYVVVNGEEQKLDYKYDEIGQVAFNPSSNRLVYLVKTGGKSFMVVDGKKKDTPYDEIEGFGFTLDGSKFIYGAKKKDSKQTAIVVNDKVLVEGDDIKLALAPESNSIIYANQDTNKKYYVVMDGKRLDGYEKIKRPLASSDGSKIFLVATKDGKDYIIKDGKEEALPSELKDKELVATNNDATKFAYQESEGGKYRIVVGDKKGESFDSIMTRSTIFSPNGSLVAYVVTINKGGTTTTYTNGAQVVVVGDQKSDEFDEVYLPLDRINFNSNGSKIAFGARKGSSIMWKVMDVK